MREYVFLAKREQHVERGWPEYTYRASKVGVSALTRVLQAKLDRERPGEDVVVNSVTPGYAKTGMTRGKGDM